jgi:hypothetical protein
MTEQKGKVARTGIAQIRFMPSGLMTPILDAIVDILVCFREACGRDVLMGDFI